MKNQGFLSGGRFILKRIFNKTACALLLLLAMHSGQAANVIAWGYNSGYIFNGPTNVPVSATNVIAVAAGWSHSFALRDNGTVLSWGYINTVPPEATNVVAIAAGAYHNLALRADGTIVAWGTNSFAVTNVPISATNIVAIAAGDYHNLALRTDGTVMVWGRNLSGETTVPSNLSNVVAIAAGSSHSTALKDNGSVAVWGGMGNLSVGHITNIVDISSGAFSDLALIANGTLRPLLAGLPKDAKTQTNIAKIAAGNHYHLGLRPDGTIFHFGSPTFLSGTVLITNIPPSATNVTAIAIGRANGGGNANYSLEHGLAVIGDGTPKILGSPSYRQWASYPDDLPLMARITGQFPLNIQWFADGSPIAGATNANPKIRALLNTDAVAYHFVVSNAFGCVTSAVASIRVTPVKAWGDALSGLQQLPSSLTNPMAIAAGGFHALALENGQVTAWGKNTSGQTNVPVSATNVVAIATGSDHSLALRADGTVIGWGRSWDGQTNIPASATNIVAIAAGWAHSLLLKSNGTVMVFGNNDYQQTNAPVDLRDVVSIAAGYYHNLALKSDGNVVAWGLGGDMGVPITVTNIVAIAAG